MDRKSMRRKNIKFMSLLMIIMMLLLSCVACGPSTTGGGNEDNELFDGESSSNKNTTQIKIMHYGGGIGDQWLRDACVRFADKVKDVSFQEGKKGVSFPDFQSTTHMDIKTLKTSGYNIYWDENQADIQNMANVGDIMDVTDIVTEKDVSGKSIEDRILPEYRKMTQYNGKYYALPHYSVYGGMAYDKDLFQKEGYYIAKPGKGIEQTYFGTTVNFTDNLDDRSCGNDGVYGTYDDGLASSLMELIVTCAYMSDNNVVPFSLAGNHTDYQNYVATALYGQLAGAQAMKANFSFKGKVEVVTGYSDEPLFSDDNGLGLTLKKPITEIKEVTPETGYLTTHQVAKYYTAAFIEIAHKSGWFSSNSSKPTANHITAQEDFIFSGTMIKNKKKDKIGFLMEGSHWWNEIRKNKVMEGYKNLTGKTERNVGYMFMPSTFDQSVQPVAEGAKPNERVVVDMTRTSMFINNNILTTFHDEGLAKACKEFMKFIYSEDEMIKFTQNTGVTRGVFDIRNDTTKPEYNKLHEVEKENISMIEDENTVRIVAYDDNKIFNDNKGKLLFALVCEPWSIKYGNNGYASYIDALRDTTLSNKNAQDMFEDKKISINKWQTEYMR